MNILDVYNIPKLGSTISLMMGEALMYKSENRNSQHYFLLYDGVKQHYDCMTDIKKFLGIRGFCYGCLSGFTDKPTFDKHKCEESGTRKKKVDRRNEGKLLKDLSRYFERGFTMGSLGKSRKSVSNLKTQDHQLKRF